MPKGDDTNPPTFHLLLNHIPVIGALFGIVLFAVAFSRKSGDTAKIGFGSFVVLALVALAVT